MRLFSAPPHKSAQVQSSHPVHPLQRNPPQQRTSSPPVFRVGEASTCKASFRCRNAPTMGPAYDEFDFVMMKEWVFDFARLPLWYWVWGSRDDWSVLREEPMKKIDPAGDAAVNMAFTSIIN